MTFKLGVVLLLVVTGCNAASIAIPASAPSSPTLTPAISRSSNSSSVSATPSPKTNPDFIITPAQYGASNQASIGQIVNLQNPDPSFDWQLSYSSDLLDLLTPPDKIQSPGDQGWLFRVKRAGVSEITLTSIARCPPGPPCPPAVASFIIHLETK